MADNRRDVKSKGWGDVEMKNHIKKQHFEKVTEVVRRKLEKESGGNRGLEWKKRKKDRDRVIIRGAKKEWRDERKRNVNEE